jgi:hypothetical protein
VVCEIKVRIFPLSNEFYLLVKRPFEGKVSKRSIAVFSVALLTTLCPFRLPTVNEKCENVSSRYKFAYKVRALRE